MGTLDLESVKFSLLPSKKRKICLPRFINPEHIRQTNLLDSKQKW